MIKKALNLPEYEPYQLFWPIQNGQLNEKMYSSLAGEIISFHKMFPRN